MARFISVEETLKYYFCEHEEGLLISKKIIEIKNELAAYFVVYNPVAHANFVSLLSIFKSCELKDAELLNKIVISVLELMYGVILSNKVCGNTIKYRLYLEPDRTIEIDLDKYHVRLNFVITNGVTENIIRDLLVLLCGIKVTYKLPIVKQENNEPITQSIESRNITIYHSETDVEPMRTIAPELLLWNGLLYPNISIHTVLNERGEIITCPTLFCLQNSDKVPKIGVTEFLRLIVLVMGAHLLTRKKDSTVCFSYSTQAIGEKVNKREWSCIVLKPYNPNPKMRQAIDEICANWQIYSYDLQVKINVYWPEGEAENTSDTYRDKMFREIKGNNLLRQKFLSDAHNELSKVNLKLNI